jgi:predicted enzyme related to lactoylglutathione lyase
VDFAAADVDAEVERLIGLGAQETGRHSVDGGFRWVVLADPDGNAFCVGAARE